MRRRGTLLLLMAVAALCAGPGRAGEPREESRIDAYRQSDRAFAQGLTSQRRGDREAAIRHYEAALAVDPEFVEAQVNLARVEMDAGDLARARELLDAAESLRPEYPAVHAVRALLALRQGDPATALDALAEAHRLAPHDIEILVNTGAAFLAQGLFEAACRVLERAVRLEPDNADAVLDLAIAEDHAGRPAHAAFGYRRFLALVAVADSDRAAATERLGVLTRSSEDLPAVARGERVKRKED